MKASSGRTAVYRHFDSAGTLLYIGVALSPVHRLSRHRLSSTWFADITTITLEWFASREAALAAERQAIKAERPKFNTAHSDRLPADLRRMIENSPAARDGAARAAFMASWNEAVRRNDAMCALAEATSQ